MLYNEWIEGKPSLFASIANEHEFQFITELGSEKLDMMYRVRYGMREVPSYLINLSTLEVANMLVIAYYSKWERYYKVFNDTLVDGVSSTETVTETSDDDTNRKMTTSTVNKISAFNDDSLSEDNSSDDSVSDDTKKLTSKTSEKSIKDFSVLEKQLALFNSSFIDTVFTDVLKYTALSIF